MAFKLLNVFFALRFLDAEQQMGVLIMNIIFSVILNLGELGKVMEKKREIKSSVWKKHMKIYNFQKAIYTNEKIAELMAVIIMLQYTFFGGIFIVHHVPMQKFEPVKFMLLMLTEILSMVVFAVLSTKDEFYNEY